MAFDARRQNDQEDESCENRTGVRCGENKDQLLPENVSVFLFTSADEAM